MEYSGPFDRKIYNIDRIADALSGTDDSEFPKGDRERDSLERIADYLSMNPPAVAGGVEKINLSTANSVAGVVTDLNKVIQALKNGGIMERDKFSSIIVQKITDSVAGHADRQYNSDKVNTIGVDKSANGKFVKVTLTLSKKVSELKDFDGGNGWGVHKWLGVGVNVGINPITGLKYNGEQLTSADIEEATLCGMDSGGCFVRWIAADLVLAGDNSQKSKDTFTLWADGYEETTFQLVIREPA